MPAVERREVPQLVVAGHRRQVGRRLQVEHGGAFGPEDRPLVAGRKPAVGPVVRAPHRRPIGVGQDDVRGQVGVERAEAVLNPRPHCRPTEHDRTTAPPEPQGRLVAGRVGLHRADERDLVDDLRGVGQALGELDSRLAVTPEREGRAEDRSRAVHDRVHLRRACVFLAVKPVEQRLGVEEIHLARPAVLEQADHPRRPSGQPPGRRRAAGCNGPLHPQKVGHGQHAREAHGRPTQERAAVQPVVKRGVHGPVAPEGIHDVGPSRCRERRCSRT